MWDDEACIILTGNAFDQTVDSNNAVRAVAVLIAIAGNLNMYSTDPDKAFDPMVTAMPKQTLVEVRKAWNCGPVAKDY